MSYSRTMSLVLVALFAALTAVGAFIKIPLPIVPFTMQPIVVFLAGSLLGSKRAFLSQIVYILVGLAGLPVFTQGSGLTYVFQPTFGYLVGFAIGAYMIGWVVEKVEKPSRKRFIVANLVGTVVIYMIGATYLYAALNLWLDTPTTIAKVLSIGVFSTIGKDIALAVFTSLLGARLYPILKKKYATKRGDQHELANTSRAGY